MSPPQVNLAQAVKQTPTVVDDEVSQENKENHDFPAVVTVDTERVHVHRLLRHQQRRRRIICFSVMLIVVALAIMAILTASLKWRLRHRNRWSCRYGKDKIGENVWVDHEHKLIHAKHGHGNPQEPSVHVLHEYGRRMAAYKDEDRNICYITRLDETFEEGYKRWESYEKKDSRDPKTLRILTDKRIEAIVVQHIADIHIYAHCHNSESYWAVEIEEIQVTSDMKIIRV